MRKGERAMEEENRRFLAGELPGLWVCVDQADSGRWAGRLYAPKTGCFCFSNEIYLLGAMERLFDRTDYPQATHKIRTFQKKPEKDGGEIKVKKDVENLAEGQEMLGKKATFNIQVKFRQNASWQGSIQWMEGKKTQNFRSVLELLKLMDEAVSQEDEQAYQGWDAALQNLPGPNKRAK